MKKSILELIYESYCESIPQNEDYCYQQIEEKLSILNFNEADELLSLINCYASKIEKKGFFDGIKVGVNLVSELSK